MRRVDSDSMLAGIDDAIQRHGLLDVHEHLLGRDQRREKNPDLFDWIGSSYLWADLVSAGLNPAKLADRSAGWDARWSELVRVLPAVAHTGYMEVCRHAWRDLCGMTSRHLDRSSAINVDAAIRAHNEDMSFSENVLKGSCGARSILVDYQVGGTAVYFFGQREELDWYRYLLRVRPDLPNELIDRNTIVRTIDLKFLHPVVKIDSLFYGWLPQAAAENHRLLGVDTATARDLDAYRAIIADAVRRAHTAGAVGLKTAHNCCRSPVLGPVDEQLAETVLERPVQRLAPEALIAFENFVMHEVARQAAAVDLPLQVHTGTTYGPGGLSSARAGAADLLADFVQEHRETTFVLMHASWPYWGELEQMAKRYPNVYLDLSWAFMLAPVESVRMMESMFTAVPSSKFLWGGDCYYVEESYGALVQAKAVVARALSGLVSVGRLEEAEAVDLADRLFCTNGRGVFKRLA